MPNSTTLSFLVAALFAGAVVPFQTGANAMLGRLLGHPLWASLVSLLVSVALLAPVMIAFRLPLPAVSAAVKGPWWIWAGGLAGVIYVTAALVLAPKLGAASFMASVIVGQLLVSVLIDHFALMGFAERPVNTARLVGIALIVAGLAVTQWAAAEAGPSAAALTTTPARSG